MKVYFTEGKLSVNLTYEDLRRGEAVLVIRTLMTLPVNRCFLRVTQDCRVTLDDGTQSNMQMFAAIEIGMELLVDAVRREGMVRAMLERLRGRLDSSAQDMLNGKVKVVRYGNQRIEA